MKKLVSFIKGEGRIEDDVRVLSFVGGRINEDLRIGEGSCF